MPLELLTLLAFLFSDISFDGLIRLARQIPSQGAVHLHTSLSSTACSTKDTPEIMPKELFELEAIAALSPLLTWHINRFGLYELDAQRPLLPIHLNLAFEKSEQDQRLPPLPSEDFSPPIHTFSSGSRPAPFTAPLAIAAGIGLGELHWQQNGATLEIPEMCITAEPTGETSISPGACEVELMPEA